MLDSVIKLLVQFGTMAGAIWIVWHAALFGFALKEHNGPDMKNALLGIIGGAVVMAAVLLFSRIATG